MAEALVQNDLITLEEVRIWSIEALKDYCRKRGYKVSGTREELCARVYFLYNNEVPENPSAAEEILARKNDYTLIYQEGPGHVVDPKRLKSWIGEKESMATWPPVSYVEICNFIQKKGCSLSKEALTTYKTGKAYSLFFSDYVKEVYKHDIKKGNPCCYMKCDCRRSNRVNDPDHNVWVKVDRTTGEIYSAYCTCYAGMKSSSRGLVLGLYKDDGKLSYTRATTEYLDANPTLKDTINKLAGSQFKQNSSRIFYYQSGYDVVCFTNLGSSSQSFDDLDDLDLGRESVRTSIFKSVTAISELGVNEVDIDCCGDAEASAEAATLAQYSYDDLKSEKKTRFEVSPYNTTAGGESEWRRGVILADAQNLARWCVEAPSNVMTPTRFAEVATAKMPSSCQVHVRENDWIEKENMNAFLSVTKGSSEKPVFLEVHYNGGGEDSAKHIALVGKGVTFDTGGISIKPSAKMDAMRGDMGGAACTLAALWAAAHLKLNVNIKGYIPLCENMPSGTAVKPGDVVKSRSGKTIQIDNTDAEGRLLLADALHYASDHTPSCIIDLATLTGAMAVSLGAGASGVFTNSSLLWQGIHQSGQSTGDRMWRMPLYKLYKDHVSKAPLADLNNIGSHAGKAGSCTAAAFLHQFVTCKHWAHLDIAGVFENSDEVPYLQRGMSGRPTRTLVQYLSKVDLSNY